MVLFRPINLPGHVWLSSTAVLGLGLYVSIFRRPPLRSTRTGKRIELFVPDPTTRRIADTNALLGITTCALMLPYFLGSYMPIEENQWLHISVPVRLLVSAALGGNLLLRGRKGMSDEGFGEFLGFAVVDMVAAVMLDLQLGRFDGVCAG